MNICPKIYNRYKEYWILIFLMILMTIITGIGNQIFVPELLIFLVFQCFCIFFPGIAIMILLPVRNLKTIEKVLFSYAIGYVFTMFLYALVMLTVGQSFVRAAFLLSGIAAIIIIICHLKKSGLHDVNEKADNILWICATLSVFLVSFIVFSLRWKAPYNGGSNCYEGDFLHWVRNIIMLKGSDFKSVVQSYRYHYLGALQQAVVSSVTGIPAMRMAACYSYIESSIFLGLSSYVLVNRMIKNKKAKVLALLFILFSTGIEDKSLVTYIWHIYLVPMSYHIAQSFGVMIISLILVQLNEEFDRNNLIIMLCFLICCTGTKGASGAIIVSGICFACLYWFFYKKQRKMAIVYAVFSVIVFGLLYMYLRSTAQSFSDDAALISYGAEQISESVGEAETKGIQLLEFVRSAARWMLSYMKKLILINPWTVIPTFIFMIYAIIHKTVRMEHILLLFTTMVGLTLSYVIIFYGHSEMYFALTVFPFSALLTGCLLDKIFTSHISDRKQLVLFIIFFGTVISFSAIGEFQHRFYEFFVRGMHNWGNPDAAERPELYAHSIISYDECQAYQWIRENASKDAIILSDGIQSIEDQAVIYAFTERNVSYYEMDDITVIALFAGDDAKIDEFRDSGIQYVIQTKSLSPAFYCPENKGKVVFENDEVGVYQLL